MTDLKNTDDARKELRRRAVVGDPKDPALKAKREKDLRKVVWRDEQERARREVNHR